MQTCMLTCVVVIQGLESVFMGWSIYGKILFLWTYKIQKKQGYHDDRRAKHSYRQTCYLPGVSPAGIRTQNRLVVFNNVGSSQKLVPGDIGIVLFLFLFLF